MEFLKLPFVLAASLFAFGAFAADYTIVETNTVSLGSSTRDLEYKWLCNKIDGYEDWVEVTEVSPKLRDDWELPDAFYDAETDTILEIGKFGDRLFINSRSLTSITFPEREIELGDSILSNCTALTSVTLSEGIWRIGVTPFFGSKIKELELPSTIEELGGNPMAGCKYLADVSVASGNQAYKYENKLLLTIDGDRLIGCLPTATKVTIPESVQSIEDGAFSTCASLKTLNLATIPTLYAGFLSDTPSSLKVVVKLGTDMWKRYTKAEFEAFLDGREVEYVTDFSNDGDEETEEQLWTYIVIDGAAYIFGVENTDGTPIETLNLPTTLKDKYPVKGIGACAFTNMTMLTSVTIPDTYEEIGDYAFSNCTSLSEISIPYGIRYIGNRPFMNTIIKSIELPDSLLDMFGNVAAGALFDTEITISDSSHFVKSDDGCIYNKDKTRLYSVPGRAEGSVTLPPTLTQIMPDAFYGCFRLKYLNIPANVTNIGARAFNVSGMWSDAIASESTPKLETVFYQGETNIVGAADDMYLGTPATLTSYVFSDKWTGTTWKGRKLSVAKSNITPIMATEENGVEWSFRIVNNSYAELYNEDANGKPYAAIPTTTAQTGYDGYINVPSSLYGYPVQKIGVSAFEGCNVCSKIVLPSTVSEISDYAFKGCTALRVLSDDATGGNGTLDIPEGVEVLGYRPFDGMTKVAKLVVPATLTSVSNNPIAGCKFISEITVAEDNKYFAFETPLLFNSTKTTLIACLPTATETTLPATLTAIASDAFAGCGKLTTITFEGAEPIADENILAATPITAVVKADAYAYDWGDPDRTEWCGRKFVNTGTVAPTGIQQYTDDSGNTWTYEVIGRGAVLGRSQLAVTPMPSGAVTIPETLDGWPVTELDEYAFANCTEVTSVVLPSSLTNVVAGAFNGCTSLEKFEVADGNKFVSTRGGLLYSKDGTTLIKVPARYAFPTTLTKTQSGVEETIRLVGNYRDSEGIYHLQHYEFISAKPITGETTVVSFLPEVDFEQYLIGVQHIADYAFCDCGELFEGQTVVGTLVTQVGSGSPTYERGKLEMPFGTDSADLVEVTTNESGIAYRYSTNPLILVCDYSSQSMTNSVTADVPVPTIPSGIDCPKRAWFGSVWYDQIPDDPLPTLTLLATPQEVSIALSKLDDSAHLTEYIKTATDYAAFRSWARNVKDASGNLAGQSAVCASPNAWRAYALNAGTLPDKEITDEDIKIEGLSVAGGSSGLSMTLSLDGLEIGSQATEANLKKVFRLSGTTSLGEDSFSSDSVSLSFGTPVNGKVPVTVAPADESATSFFMKANLQ